MEFLVKDTTKELKVIGREGNEYTEYFMDLAFLIKDGQVWEDEYENFCMSEDTYEYWHNMCRMQTNITNMEQLLSPSEYEEYVKYAEDTVGYDYEDNVSMREHWLICKIAERS